MAEDEIGWHHQFNRHEFEQTLKDGGRQGSLVCGSPQGHKELGITEQQNEKKTYQLYSLLFVCSSFP